YFTLTAPATTLPPTLSLHDALPICYSSKHPQQFVIKITSKKQGFATNPVSCLLRKYVAVCIFKLFEDFIRPTYAGKILMPYSSGLTRFSIRSSHNVFVLTSPVGMRVTNFSSTFKK